MRHSSSTFLMRSERSGSSRCFCSCCDSCWCTLRLLSPGRPAKDHAYQMPSAKAPAPAPIAGAKRRSSADATVYCVSARPSAIGSNAQSRTLLVKACRPGRHSALYGNLMKCRWPDQPAQGRRHDGESGYLRQLGRTGDMFKLLLKANAITETEQHLAAQDQHSNFAEHVFNSVT